jgi:hypothetical protein
VDEGGPGLTSERVIASRSSESGLSGLSGEGDASGETSSGRADILILRREYKWHDLS